MKRRWLFAGIGVVIVSASIFALLVIASAPPFRFIHGRKVCTLVDRGGWVVNQTIPTLYRDYYVFPGSLDVVRKEALKELTSPGFVSESLKAPYWFYRTHTFGDSVAIGDCEVLDKGLWDYPDEIDVPEGSVVVMVRREKPNMSERIRLWFSDHGL